MDVKDKDNEHDVRREQYGITSSTSEELAWNGKTLVSRLDGLPVFIVVICLHGVPGNASKIGFKC